jgi:hypothetical protein
MIDSDKRGFQVEKCSPCTLEIGQMPLESPCWKGDFIRKVVVGVLLVYVTFSVKLLSPSFTFSNEL